MPKSQAPIVRPLPALADRPVRFAQAWRTVALLADQASEVKAKYPTAITADNYERMFEQALAGLLALHRDFWRSSSQSDLADARQADVQDEQNWLTRNHIRPAG